MEKDKLAYILLGHPQANPFDSSSRTYESPTATAIRLGRIDVLKRIDDDRAINWNNYINVIDPERGGRSRMTPLFFAVESGRLGVVKLLVEKDGVNALPISAVLELQVHWMLGLVLE